MLEFKCFFMSYSLLAFVGGCEQKTFLLKGQFGMSFL